MQGVPGRDFETKRDGGEMKFRKKPVIVDATQWFKNGDHPEDECALIPMGGPLKGMQLSEGKVVRYYRHPNVPWYQPCPHCGRIMHDHGWIDTLEGCHVVCPGDWIITGVSGEKYPCKPDIFEKTYDPVDEADKSTERS